ncbi:TPA: pirin family protein, partial [Klebsiella pneumoniae]
LGPAGYHDYAAEDIPHMRRADGVEVRVIAGRFDDGQQPLDGAVQRPHTEPQLFDLQLPAGGRLEPRLADGLRVLLYVYEGELQVNGQPVAASQLARLDLQGDIRLSSENGAQLLLIAGRPLNEPIVQYGPFVMNSREQIEQALQDYRNGRLTD